VIIVKNEKVITSPSMKMKDRVPPGQKVTKVLPVLHYGSVPEIDVARWKFTISGLVKKERELSHRDFMALPHVKVLSDVHCVTGWSVLDNTWDGISTGEVPKLVKVLPEAKFVIVHSVGGFTTNLTLDDFLEQDVLFAVEHNGEPIKPEHGYPVRLVVPRLYFWKSAKWVNGVEFVAEDRPGFWESHGYHNRGDPWKEERYSNSGNLRRLFGFLR
jgi:DMSO/TMAO reductase YedYZ molybdopterin-dependent catalytic subunit